MSTHLWKLLGVGAAAVGVLLLLVYKPSIYTFFGSFLVVAAAVWFAEHESVTRLPPWNRAVLITGCDTGFGHELAYHLDAMGITVFAGCLFSQGKGAETLRTGCSKRVHVIQLDVTSDDQVADAVKYVEREVTENSEKGPKGLWGVVNNAGIDGYGDIDISRMEDFRRICEVNQFGMVRVTKAFLPLIIQKQGRIINVTSVKGRMYLPFCAPYAMTKHAGEVFSDILRLEMKKWGVQVSIIEPGNFCAATAIIDFGQVRRPLEEAWEAMGREKQDKYGRAYMEHHQKCLEGAIPVGCQNVYPVLDAMTDALLAIKPKARYLIPGSRKLYDVYKWVILALPYLPTCIMDRVIMWIYAYKFETPKMLK